MYITPVLGGYLADRWLGQRKAVLFGGVLLTAGHFMMAFEGRRRTGTMPTINVFWLALALIIVGSGFLKANISVMVGQLYPLTDIRRDGAYTIFYMGINVGAAIGTILAGYLGETYRLGATASALAGIGMLLGLVVFVLGKPPCAVPAKRRKPLAANKEFTLYGAGLVGVAVIWGLIQYQDVIQNLLIVSGMLLLGYVLYESLQARPALARPHLRDPVPDRAQPGVLGPVRAGRRLAQPLHRPLRRSRRGAGIAVPVDQPDLHHPAGAVVRDPVELARPPRPGALGTGQVRPRSAAGRRRLPGLRVRRGDVAT